MDKIWPIILITFREGIRNRAIQGILLIAVLLCFAYLSVIPMFAFDTGKVMVDLGGASTSLAGLVIVIFLAISMLAKDIHQRSICLILSRPVSRADYIIGKFCGLALLVLIAISIVAGMAFASGALGLRFVLEMAPLRNFSWGTLLLSVSFNYLGLLVLLSIAFFFTMATTSEFLSMILTVIVYMIGNSLETIIKVASVGTDIKISQTYLGLLKVVSWIFPNFSAFDRKLHLSYGLPLQAGEVIWVAAYGISYVLMVLGITIMMFNRKEIQ